jgi:hypothetical protein
MAKGFYWVSLALAALCGCDSKGTTQGKFDAEDYCALAGACGLEGESMSFGECVYLLNPAETSLSRGASTSTDAQMHKASVECALAASTCDELVACTRPTSAQLAVCDSDVFTACSGNVLVSCSEDPQDAVAVDCGKSGLVCGSSPSGAWCGLGTCDAAPRCEGNTLFACHTQGNVLTSEDCTTMGKVCGKTPAGTTGCVGKVACDSLSDMRCEGSVRVSCDDGTESRRDCAELGADWTCAITKGESWTSMSCVPVAKECTIGKDETCSGSVIGYCQAGHPATYDCKSAGFSGCTTTTRGTATCVK